MVVHNVPRGILKNYRRGSMIKYGIAWLLGVPIGVLILVYIFMHLF